MLPVALDAMGGDRAPGEIVAGARQAFEELGIPVVLVGDPKRLADIGELPVLAAGQVIEMHEDPAQGVRRKKDSSLVRAAEAVRDGTASAMVSAGNTGATMASALFRMGRISGVARPAIATPIPVPGTTPTVLLDAGANAECLASWLVQFAQMGSAFSRVRYGIATPRVGLLSIGEEDSKGTPLVKEAHALLAAGAAGPGIEFIGNVEGRDIMSEHVDVVVTDGFTGNIALKTAEGVAEFLFSAISTQARASLSGRIGGLLLKPKLRPIRDRVDYRRTGGALLLGVAGEVVIAHGRSDAVAIMNALRVADAASVSDVHGTIARELGGLAAHDGGGDAVEDAVGASTNSEVGTAR
jgi:glycerol-3-phosphate acyltransferase PlsX